MRLLHRFLRTLSPWAAGVALLAGAAPAAGQSLFSTRGLGLLVEPRDARMDALGGVSLGLADNGASWANPADAIGIPVPSLVVAGQYDSFTSTFGGQSVDGSTARFPLILGAFPVGERLAFTLGYGAFLDQNYAVQRGDTLNFAGDTVAVLDRITSNGGVARLRGGVAYRVLPGLALGVAADAYTGNVRRNVGRLFPNEAAPRCCSAEWNYQGVGYTLGATWHSPALTLSAAATAGGELRARGQDSTAENRSYDLPLSLRAGASGRVAGNLLLALSGEWAGWSKLDDALATTGGARDSRSVHGGIEWDAITLRDRPIPLRIGGRMAELPFRWGSGSDAREWARERALTAGTGIVLGGGAARTDLGFERGRRGAAAAGLEESYWRLVFSMTVLGR